MKKLLKRAFTIVELVIVIAVIAILAAVLIPTFSNIIKKAQISADVQLCRNLNTVLAYGEAEGRIPGSVYDVLYLENEAGYIIENLNPTSEGYYYAWDEKNNKIVYIMDDLETVYYPAEYELDHNTCWITVGSAEEAERVASKGYNLALEKDINETITLSNVVSINTLGFKAGNIEFTGSGAQSLDTAYMIGTFGDISGNIGSTSIVTSGTASTLDVSGNSAASITVGGYVGSMTASGVSNATVSSTGLVNTIGSSTSTNVVNNGVIIDTTQVNEEAVVITGNGAATTEGNTVAASTKEDLESIRFQVSTGSRNFDGETVELSNNINLNGIAFTPIANISREGITASNQTAFRGTFDGQGYSIINFSTQGFSITGLNAGTNSTTPLFGEGKIMYNEAVYGLFGVTYNATIKNVNVVCDINMVLDNANRYVGDSVGGIVGCAFGTITFENCTVSGTINAYDGVGGFLGRLKGTEATFINCTNNADVTGVRKTGAFIGSTYNSLTKVTYENCVNNGNITCLGIEKDIELVTWSNETTRVTGTPETSNYSGYYTASASNGEFGSANENSYMHLNGKVVGSVTNNGTVKVGSVNVGDGTYYAANATGGQGVATYPGK